MTPSNRQLPRISAPSNARNAFQREGLTTAKNWATAYLGGHETAALQKGLGLVKQLPEAHVELASSPRAAYLRLTRELERRAA